MSAAIEKSFCTTREAAGLLGVSVGTVQLWAESGLLQAWKTSGGHRRVMRDSVERLLRRGSSSSAVHKPAMLSETNPRQLSVMVVEDDPDLLRLYQIRLSDWSMRPIVTCVDNAVAALMMLGRGGPDLLISDLRMPGMDGFRMLRVLDLAPEMKRTRIVVVTGLDAQAIVAQGGLPASIEILSKPIPFDRLLAMATGIVNQSSFQMP